MFRGEGHSSGWGELSASVTVLSYIVKLCVELWVSCRCFHEGFFVQLGMSDVVCV
jgi:hypothetical protein